MSSVFLFAAAFLANWSRPPCSAGSRCRSAEREAEVVAALEQNQPPPERPTTVPADFVKLEAEEAPRQAEPTVAISGFGWQHYVENPRDIAELWGAAAYFGPSPESRCSHGRRIVSLSSSATTLKTPPEPSPPANIAYYWLPPSHPPCRPSWPNSRAPSGSALSVACRNSDASLQCAPDITNSSDSA